MNFLTRGELFLNEFLIRAELFLIIFKKGGIFLHDFLIRGVFHEF